MVAIRAQGLTKMFATQSGTQVAALNGVDLDIRENEFFTLLGPSGCGKTTLLRLIAGFEHPSAGRLLLNGEPIEHCPPYRRPVNTVFQSYALFPHMTVGENVAFGLEMAGMAKPEIQSRVRDMLALVKLPDMANRMPSHLSGGQQQRVALARALANKPRVLLLDEPLSALDLKLRKDMQIELKKIQRETGVTFVFVTHDQGEALTMSDRIAVLNEGHVLQVGSPRVIYDQPVCRFVADFIGETNLLTGETIVQHDRRARIRLDGGAEIDVATRRTLAPGESISLAVRPERTILASEDEALVLGTVSTVLYTGTDTIIEIDAGLPRTLQIRRQNGGNDPQPPQPGEKVGARFASDCAQVLDD